MFRMHFCTVYYTCTRTLFNIRTGTIQCMYDLIQDIFRMHFCTVYNTCTHTLFNIGTRTVCRDELSFPCIFNISIRSLFHLSYKPMEINFLFSCTLRIQLIFLIPSNVCFTSHSSSHLVLDT